MTKEPTLHTCKYCGAVEAWYEDCVKNICLSCNNFKSELPFFRITMETVRRITLDIEREQRDRSDNTTNNE